MVRMFCFDCEMNGFVTFVKTGFVRLFETQADLMNPYGYVNAFSLYTFLMCVTLLYHYMFVLLRFGQSW